jgi:hypothetical protein
MDGSMAPLALRRAVAGALAALCAMTAAGCGNDDSVDQPSPEPVSVASSGGPYVSHFFAVPLSVTLAPELNPASLDTQGLLSWDAAATAEKKMRIWAPVEVYPPGKTDPVAPPADFGAYVETLAAAGAKFTDTKQIQVGGRPATLATATTAAASDDALDGTLGCVVRGDDRVDDCYGVQSDLVLRVAVIDLGDQTLLAAAKVTAAAPDPAFFAAFERMLTTVQFT